MTDHSDLIARLRAAIDLGDRTGSRGKRPENIYNVADEALTALSSQSLSLSEAREEIERLKGLVAGIRECPQEPVDVSAWRKAMEGVTPGDWSANGRFISAIGGVDTCEGAVYATIITCDHTYQSDGEGRHWSTTGSAERNAAWIVKCSPPAVAKLLDAYEAARSRAAEWAGSFGSKCGDHQAALRRTEDEREACAQLVENQMPASQDMTSTFICEALERAAAAIRARSVLENSKAPLADATNDPADLSSLRKGAEALCPHAPTYDAGLCCGHPDDCTFVSPSGLSKWASATEDGIRAKLLRLAKALHAKHYAHVPQWEPFEDAYGLIDQIDNMTAALVSGSREDGA